MSGSWQSAVGSRIANMSSSCGNSDSIRADFPTADCRLPIA
jgi:hypothetical protein